MSILKSYGTVLRDHPDVDRIAREFYTFKINPSDTISANKIPKKTALSLNLNVEKISINELIPKSFRGHHVWANYITLPEYLEDCGDDWALSVCHCISDRYSIFSLGQIQTSVNSNEILYCGNLERPQYMPSVKSQSKLDLKNICVGYSVYDSAKYIYQHGISEASCFNRRDIEKRGFKKLTEYGDHRQLKTDIPTCDTLLGQQLEHCTDVKLPRRVFRILGFINIDGDGADGNYSTIKYEIYRYGPVVAGFLMFRDFIDNYDGTTIYMGPPPSSEFLGGHSVRILGWGRDNNINFWILSNNWSTSWGEGGYFRMKMGIPECQLENNVVAPIVNLSHMNYTYEPAEVLQVPDDLRDKNPPILIRETFYSPYTTQLIRDGKLEGDLEPLIYKDFKIDSESFWAGDIDFYVKNYKDIGTMLTKPRLGGAGRPLRNVSQKNIAVVLILVFLGVWVGRLLYRYIEKK